MTLLPTAPRDDSSSISANRRVYKKRELSMDSQGTSVRFRCPRRQILILKYLSLELHPKMCEFSGDGFACFEHFASQPHIQLDGLWNEIDNILRIFSMLLLLLLRLFVSAASGHPCFQQKKISGAVSALLANFFCCWFHNFPHSSSNFEIKRNHERRKRRWQWVWRLLRATKA